MATGAVQTTYRELCKLPQNFVPDQLAQFLARETDPSGSGLRPYLVLDLARDGEEDGGGIVIVSTTPHSYVAGRSGSFCLRKDEL